MKKGQTQQFTQLIFRFSPEMKDALKQLAKANKRSMTKQLEYLVEKEWKSVQQTPQS
jgi:hypothetical protein